jgi:hypothetical protein
LASRTAKNACAAAGIVVGAVGIPVTGVAVGTVGCGVVATVGTMGFAVGVDASPVGEPVVAGLPLQALVHVLCALHHAVPVPQYPSELRHIVVIAHGAPLQDDPVVVAVVG